MSTAPAISQTGRSTSRRQLGWRWLKFNLVGGIGIGVQLATLWMLVHVLRCNYLLATGLAVETAVLHNFVWHHRFTWSDRILADRVNSHWRDIALRLLHFNLTNGAVSIVHSVLNGRVFGGDTSNMQIVSGDTLTAPTRVPEPSSPASFVTVLGGVGAVLFRRLRTSSAR